MNSRIARFPFFYGWVVLGAGTIGMLMSAPGQTVGVSVFTDLLIDALGLTRSQLSLAYLVGTMGSAVLLARTGGVYDRLGGRRLATGAAAALAIVLVLLSFSGDVAAAMRSAVAAPAARVLVFATIAVGFFLLRFSGQGMLTLASRNMVMEWFSRRRGLANAFIGVSISFGFSVAPRLFEGLIRRYDWFGAWRVLGGALAAFAVVAWMLYRDRPEDYGLVPDGPLADRPMRTHPESVAGRDFTLREARRTRAFRLFVTTTALAGTILTAYTFHIVSIFADAGLSRTVAVSVFFPAAIVAVIVEFIGSWLSDFVKLKWLAIVQLSGVTLLAVAIAVLQPGLPVVMAIVGHGLMQGMFGILSNVTWPRFFGRAHLGAISGFATSLVVFGTAVGPYLFSLLRDATGGYAAASLILGAAALVTATLMARAERPA